MYGAWPPPNAESQYTPGPQHHPGPPNQHPAEFPYQYAPGPQYVYAPAPQAPYPSGPAPYYAPQPQYQHAPQLQYAGAGPQPAPHPQYASGLPYAPDPVAAAAPQYAPMSQNPAVAQRLTEIHGVVVRQDAQVGEAIAQTFGVPIESANSYRVAALPPGKSVKTHPEDPDGWEPTHEELTALDALLFAHEESNSLVRTCLTFLGCKSLRPLKLRFTVAASSGDVYLGDRPFRLGGLCCAPAEMTVDSVGADGQLGRRLGRVREDFSPYFSRCLATCCLATTYTDIERALPDGSYEKRYALRTNLSCCGRVNNCCGATCCKNDAVYDVLDARGEIVAHLQHTYAGDRDWARACCRMSFGFTSYVLAFPPDATQEDRVLLLAALFHIDYQHFEDGGDE